MISSLLNYYNNKVNKLKTIKNNVIRNSLYIYNHFHNQEIIIESGDKLLLMKKRNKPYLLILSGSIILTILLFKK